MVYQLNLKIHIEKDDKLLSLINNSDMNGISAAIAKLKQQQERPECLALGNKFKRLVKIDQHTIHMIVHLP